MSVEVDKLKKCLSNWDVLPFSEAIKDVTAGNPKVKQSEYRKSGILAVIDQGHDVIGGYIDDKSLACKEELPCILFGDHTKNFKFIDQPFALGADGVKLLAPIGEFDKRFLYYYLRTLKLPIDVGYSRHYKFLKEKCIVKPPLAEQKRIAAILDKADAIRRKRQQAIKFADDFLRATFLDMFGDPVTNPKGLKVRFLSMLCDVRDGTHDSPKYVEDGYPLITSKNVKDGFIDFSDVSLVSEEAFIQINKRSKVDIGDIIMPMIGTIGHPVIVETNRPFAIKNVALIKFKTTFINNRYILHLLRSNYFNWIIQKQNRGGTQKFIALSDIRNFPIPVPGEKDLSKFDTVCRKLESIVLKKNDLGTEGKDLFNSLTQRAFRGEL